jgi:hypothetical protein
MTEVIEQLPLKNCFSRGQSRALLGRMRFYKVRDAS